MSGRRVADLTLGEGTIYHPGGIDYDGRFYSVRGLHPGPAPAHPIGIWLGAYKPRMLALTGRAADGWVPSLPYAPPAQIPALRQRVDDAAAAAGRDPHEIRRVYNLMGTITDGAATGLACFQPAAGRERLSCGRRRPGGCRP